MKDDDIGYSSGEERYQAEVRRAVALSAQNCPPEPETAADRAACNRRSRPLPSYLASALLSSNLATPSAIAASSIAHGSEAARAARAIRGSKSRGRPTVPTGGPSRPGGPSTELSALSSLLTRQPKKEEKADTDNKPKAPVMSQFGSLVLDRKQMEAERLERARLRAAQQQLPASSSSSQVMLGKRVREPDSSPVKEGPPSLRPKIEPQSSAKAETTADSPSFARKDDIKSPSAVEILSSDDEELLPNTVAPAVPEKKKPVTIELDSGSESEAKLPQKDSKKESKASLEKPMKSKAASVTSSSSWASFSSLPFPKGIVKKTWLRASQRTGNEISLEEVLQKDQLQLAIVSSYQWDGTFFLKHVDTSHTKVLMVAHSYDADHKIQLENALPNENVRYVFPPMYRGGIMHSKLMILKFPSYLRIVVPTGNFVDYDWGYRSAIENHVFLIDLPKRQDPLCISGSGPFGKSLHRFLELSGLPEKLISSMRNYDFTEANKYRFVYSAATEKPQRGNDRDMNGLCGLASAVKDLGFASSNSIEVDIVASSIGRLDSEFIKSIYSSCRGYLLSDRNEDQDGVKKDIEDDFKKHMRVYFPSLETVNNSLYGRVGAGTIFMTAKWWDLPSFPREVFRDCVSIRQKILMHTKIFFMRNETDEGPKAWAYVGSHNLSQKAWGRLYIPKKAEPSILNDSWECGVIVPVDTSSTNLSNDLPPLSVFENTIPVPFDVDQARQYSSSPDLRPWSQL